MNKNIINKIMERKDSYESEIARLKRQLNDYQNYVYDHAAIHITYYCDIHYLCDKDPLLLKDYLKRWNVKIGEIYEDITYPPRWNDTKDKMEKILHKIYDHIGDDFYTKEEIDEFVEFIHTDPIRPPRGPTYQKLYEEYKRKK
jgi:hypothetical protein